MIALTHRDRESSHSVVSKDLLVSDDDMEWPISLLSTLRPVSLTLDTSTLLHIGHHDDGRGMLLPN